MEGQKKAPAMSAGAIYQGDPGSKPSPRRLAL